MSNLVPFDFNGDSIRAINLKNEPWFVAEDVCKALGLSNPTMSLKSLDDDERSKFNLGRQGEVNIINESGLFTLTLRCRDALTQGTKPYLFRKWVTGEVLPSIRKTGSYTAKQESNGLLQFRKARAIKMATDSIKEIYTIFPNLSEQSKQVIGANVLNPIIGAEVIPLPKLEHKTYSATEIGEKLGISANKVGRIAKELGLKTAEFGMYVLDKSAHSVKQVETFRYFENAIDVINSAINKAS